MSHDRFFKGVFGEAEHAIACFQSYLPAEILAQADLSTATLCPGSFVDEQLSERHTDLLYQLQFAGRKALIYVLFEHQRSCETAMMFRLLRYMVRIWERWLEEHSISEGLPPIIPMVLYQGRRDWTAATRLSGLLAVELRPAQDPERSEEEAKQDVFRRYFPDFEMLLIDLSEHSDDDLRGTALGRLALHLFKNIDSPEIMSFLRRWAQIVRQVSQESGLNGLRLALHYLLQSSEHVSKEELGLLLATEVGDDAREMVMTAADKLRAEGRDEGLKKGREEGHEAGHEEGLKKGHEEGRRKGRRKGRKKGRREGSLKGRQAMLLRLLEARFGKLPGKAKARVMSARVSQLDDWAVRALHVAALDELLDAGALGLSG